jgi:hypothetical protein
MTDVTPNSPDDERWDEMIAGCRVLRARREPYLNTSPKVPAATEANQPSPDVLANNDKDWPDSETALDSKATGLATVGS